MLMSPATATGATADDDEHTRLLRRDKEQQPRRQYQERDGDTNSYREEDTASWTFSRRMVAHYLAQNRWYFPLGSSTGGSSDSDGNQRQRSRELGAEDDTTTEAAVAAEQQHHQMLQDAWGYFEHVTLPRHFVVSTSTVSQEDTDDDTTTMINLEKAKPGESALATQLYSVWETRESDLADLGMGVGLYFLTLRALGWIFLVAGLLNLPIMWYYYTTTTGNGTDDSEVASAEANNLDWILKSSVICTDQKWVPCPTCKWHDWDYFPRKFDRYAQTLQVDAGGHHFYEASLTFIKVNSCRFGYTLGIFSLISVVFLAAALYFLSFEMLRRREVQLDEATQTTQDYSLRVENPPLDANNAEEWKAFFTQFGSDNTSSKDHGMDAAGTDDPVVTCCSVALDNEVLVRALVERRRLLIQLESLLKPGVVFDRHNLDHAVENAMEEDLASWWQKVMFGSGSAAEIRLKIRLLDKEAEDLSQQTYNVSEVFITFETEESQRRALKALSLSLMGPLIHKIHGPVLPHNLLFREEHVLRVREAPEPTAVRWHELDSTLPEHILQRLCSTTLTLACILGSMCLIAHMRYRHGASIAALVISILNSCVPYLCQGITSLESHAEEDTKSTSRYIKITIFLFVNTAVVTSLITPFTDTVANDPGAITKSLYAIHIFELIRGPITQLLDPAGFLYRHVLGPRTKNFKRMLLFFRGTPYELSERYTDMTNVIFLTFYYAVIFPAGFLFAAATLFVHYWTDKFCVLRVWAQAPEEGTRISIFCRSFIMMSLVIYVVMSAYAISAFPYDNACEDPNSKPPPFYLGNFTAYDFDNNAYHISIPPHESTYHFCNQDFLRYRPFAVFPPLSSRQPKGGEWMDPDQEIIADVFSWTSVAAILFVLIVLMHHYVVPFLRGLFFSTYEPSGSPSHLRFSEINEIFAYVPQVRIAEGSFPVLVCDVSNLDPELLGWHDPFCDSDGGSSSSKAHNVLYDIPGLADKPIFSTVHHWASPSSKRAKAGSNDDLDEEPSQEEEEEDQSLLGILARLFT